MTQEPQPDPRPLTPDEEAVLVALIENGVCRDEGRVVTEDDRARWLAQVSSTRAGRRCGCGACPSLDLTGPDGVTPDVTEGRVVLEASTTGALLLLFVDDDRLSYLELAPLDDSSYDRFPDPCDLQFIG